MKNEPIYYKTLFDDRLPVRVLPRKKLEVRVNVKGDKMEVIPYPIFVYKLRGVLRYVFKQEKK